jgi:hypothetical protein
MKTVSVFKTKSNIEAMGIERMLLENAVPCQVINKMDSSYGNTFGDIVISVEEPHSLKAKKLISEYFED